MASGKADSFRETKGPGPPTLNSICQQATFYGSIMEVEGEVLWTPKVQNVWVRYWKIIRLTPNLFFFNFLRLYCGFGLSFDSFYLLGSLRGREYGFLLQTLLVY